jgi:hypothetical protein
MNLLFHPRRELARTGFKATMLGIGDVADRNVLRGKHLRSGFYGFQKVPMRQVFSPGLSIW